MRTLLLIVGFGLLGWGALDVLAPRPHPLNWMPAPGAVADSSLDVIRIVFDRPLHASSYAYAQDLERGSEPTPPSASRIDPGDPSGRTLLISLPDPAAGVYEVRWHARSRPLSFLPLGAEGRYRFAVAARPPADSAPHQWPEDALDPTHGGDARPWLFLAGGLCLLVARQLRPRVATPLTKV